MKPSHVSQALTRIAAALDSSNQPSRTLVARDLRRILAAVDPKVQSIWLKYLESCAINNAYASAGGFQDDLESAGIKMTVGYGGPEDINFYDMMSDTGKFEVEEGGSDKFNVGYAGDDSSGLKYKLVEALGELDQTFADIVNAGMDLRDQLQEAINGYINEPCKEHPDSPRDAGVQNPGLIANSPLVVSGADLEDTEIGNVTITGGGLKAPIKLEFGATEFIGDWVNETLLAALPNS